MTTPVKSRVVQSSDHARWATIGIVTWLGLVLVGLDLVHDPTVYDKTLLPRLHALLIVLGAAIPVLVLPRTARRLDLSVLGQPVMLCAAAYAVCTALSLLVAWNAGAGVLDVVRTSAFVLVLGLTCLMLPLLPRWPDRLIQLLVVSSFVTAGWGWSELVTKHGVGVHERRWIEDVSGRMGNINFLASYLVLVLPGCLAAGCMLRGAWRWCGLVSAVGSLALVVLLQSRSAYLALAVGAITALAVAWTWRESLALGRRFRAVVAALVLGLACGAGGFVWIAGPEHPVVARLRSIGDTRLDPDHRADGGRAMIWRLTGRLIADHPLAGVGAGNFPLRIPEYYRAAGDGLQSLPSDNWLQPHNDFLQICAEKGVLGLAAFIGIFVSAFLSIGRTLRRADRPADGRLAVFLLMSLTAYLVSSCFDFPLERISHQATLAVLLAAATVLDRRETSRANHAGDVNGPGVVNDPGDVRTLRWAAAAALICLAPGLAWTSVAISQERAAEAARVAIEEQRWGDAVRFARRATTPWRTLVARGTPVAFLEGVGHMQLGAVAAATAAMERARGDHPNSFVVLNNLGILHAAAGRTDDAIACLTLAMERYPHRLESVANLAGCYLDAGRPADAVALLEDVPDARRVPVIRDHLARGRAMLERPAKVPADDAPSRTP